MTALKEYNYLFVAVPTNSWMRRFLVSCNLNGNNSFSCNLRLLFFVRAFRNLPNINPSIDANTAQKPQLP
jgi:hypothetical protein